MARSRARRRANSKSSVYKGVRKLGIAVEIKKWCGNEDFYRVVDMPEPMAALLYDLLKLYVDENCDKLNIETLERKMQLEDPGLAGFGMVLRVGKEFLKNFVRTHRLALEAGEESAEGEGSAEKRRVELMKDQIVALAPEAFEGLKEEIIRYHFRAGCQRKELAQIYRFPPVHVSEPQECNKDGQDWKALCEAKDADITLLKEFSDADQERCRVAQKALVDAQKDGQDWKALCEAKDADITLLKEFSDAAQERCRVAQKALDDAQKDGQDWKALCEAKDADITLLKEFSDAEQERCRVAQKALVDAQELNDNLLKLNAKILQDRGVAERKEYL